MKTTSRFALIAAAGLMMVGGSSLSAKAADLGGDCCADLEERVAELEATTARKGNRKVSLEISGQVDKGLLVWNDGKSSDAYIVDNNYSSSRFRFKGSAQMAPGWKAGFYMEWEFRDSSSNLSDQTFQSNRGLENALRIRAENVFIESEKFGRVTIGQGYQASKDIEVINLGGGMNDPENYYAAGFKVRDNTLGNTSGTNGTISNASRLSWTNLADTWDPGRLQNIRYDTPSIYGFILSASWGENDFWDIALRYQKEWNSIRIAAGVAYAWYGDTKRVDLGFPETDTSTNSTCYNNPGAGITPGGVQRGPCTKFETIKGSISAIHVPTGIYGMFAAGERHYIDAQPGNPFVKDGTFYYGQVGITKRFFDVGATTFYGEYGSYQDQAAGARYDGTLTGPAVTLTGSDVTRWGAGFTQAFDGAALELYANYVHYSADLKAVSGGVGAFGGPVSVAPQDFDAVITGARIKF